MGKLELKHIAGYTAGILIFMSAMRLLLETQSLGIPIMDFISFSNMIVYVLDILYGTWPFFFVACILILFRKNIDKLIVRTRNRKNSFFSGFALFCIILPTASIVVILYKFASVTYFLSIILKVLIFLGIGLTGIAFKYCLGIREHNFLLAIMIFAFVFLSTKIVIQYEKYFHGPKEHISTVIRFKDPERCPFISDSICRYVTTTMDFTFTYNEKTKAYTAYPMAEIFSIETKGK
jgi:hypothetical protein